MKKKWIIVFLSLFLAVFFTVPAAAKSPLVLDYAGLLSSAEEASLNVQLEELQSQFMLDIVILTSETLMGNQSAQDYADDFYEHNYGDNGILFLVDIGSRQWHISTSGTAVTLLSDQELMEIEDAVVHYLSGGSYYDAFDRLLNILPEYLNSSSEQHFSIVTSLLIGGIIAGITLLIMRGTMNTKRPQRSAGNYQEKGSYHLRLHQDLFLYSNLTKRQKPQNNSSGSTHRSSSGRIHGGRGGKF